jgi:acid phosphatase (class A)
MQRSPVSLPRCWAVLAAVIAIAVATTAAASPFYLAPTHVDAVMLLPAPPLTGSPEDRVDLDTTRDLHAHATAAELAEAADEVKLTVFHFAPVLGPWFRAEKLPKTEALFRRVEADAKLVTNAGKKHWQRIRPYHVAPDAITGVVEHEPKTDYAYPSGHATRGTVYALLLAELFPDRRDALIARGREIGWLRVLGGVHYPQDIFAGRVLGQALARDFLASPQFQRDLENVRAEISAARITP